MKHAFANDIGQKFDTMLAYDIITPFLEAFIDSSQKERNRILKDGLLRKKRSDHIRNILTFSKSLLQYTNYATGKIGCPKKGFFFYFSWNFFANLLKISLRSIHRYVKDLIAMGVIVVEKIPGTYRVSKRINISFLTDFVGMSHEKVEQQINRARNVEADAEIKDKYKQSTYTARYNHHRKEFNHKLNQKRNNQKCNDSVQSACAVLPAALTHSVSTRPMVDEFAHVKALAARVAQPLSASEVYRRSETTAKKRDVAPTVEKPVSNFYVAAGTKVIRSDVADKALAEMRAKFSRKQ